MAGRRYNWNALITGNIPSPNLSRKQIYLSINGKLIGIDPTRLPPGAALNLIMRGKDSSTNFLSLPIDRKGNVFTDGMIFYDNMQLYFQMNDKKKHV